MPPDPQSVIPLAPVADVETLHYAKTGLRNMSWSALAIVAFLVALSAIPGPILLMIAMEVYRSLRHDETLEVVSVIWFFGGSTLAPILAIAARIHFNKKGHLPRGLWFAEWAFLLSIIDATIAGLVGFYAIAPYLRGK